MGIARGIADIDERVSHDRAGTALRLVFEGVTVVEINALCRGI